MMEHRVDIWHQHPLHFRSDGPAHGEHSVDGKMGIHLKIYQAVLGDEAPKFDHVIGNFALDIGELDHRCAVARVLKYPAKQAELIVQCRARPCNQPG